MKKLLANLLIITLAVMSLAGCGNKSEEATDANLTPAGQFMSAIEKNIGTSDDLLTVADTILATDGLVPFAPASMPVEEGYLNGFSAEIYGFSEGVVMGPMIGSIPFIAYIFKTDDTEALKQTLNDNADLRWNICTQADELKISSKGDYVFIVMSPNSFDE